MSLFRKKTPPPAYALEEYEPVLRCSICTGEQTACVRHRQSGKMLEIMLIRTPEELAGFCAQYQTSPERIQRVY